MSMDQHRTAGVRTTASEVRDTYYGQPVIKLPHWRWLVIFYFFFGAIAGGSYTIGTIANLFSRDRAVERAARYLAFAAVLPCPILLVLDLGRPERALNMFRVIKLKSPMSLGSWALLGLGMAASVSAALQALSDLSGRDLMPSLHRTVGILGLPFSVFISGYTGVLLAATNVPLWARNYLLIGPTFIASAFSGSFAALSILLGFGSGEREGTVRSLARAEVACISMELVALTAGIVHLGKLGKPLTTGRYGRIFWPGTYVGGILLPLGLQLAGPVSGHSGSRPRRIFTAVLVLAGGFILRTLMIFAGRESADRPEDYFEYTRRTPGPYEYGSGR
jgi:formate-dependent nitrite reductase membrane component NrfD